MEDLVPGQFLITGIPNYQVKATHIPFHTIPYPTIPLPLSPVPPPLLSHGHRVQVVDIDSLRRVPASGRFKCFCWGGAKNPSRYGAAQKRPKQPPPGEEVAQCVWCSSWGSLGGGAAASVCVRAHAQAQ